MSTAEWNPANTSTKSIFLDRFSQVLSDAREEAIHRFLSEHAFLFVAYFDLMNPLSFQRTGRANYYGHYLIHRIPETAETFGEPLGDNCALPYYPVFSKVRLGEKFVTDFALADVGSRGFVNWILLELESPTTRPFTKQARPSRALATALAQVQDWRRWILENISYARTVLLGRRVRFFFRIIVGRRAHLDARCTDRLEEMHRDLSPSIEVMHYDRLFDVATRLPDDFYVATGGRYCGAFTQPDLSRIMGLFPRSWLDASVPDPIVDQLPEDDFKMPPPP